MECVCLAAKETQVLVDLIQIFGFVEHATVAGQDLICPDDILVTSFGTDCLGFHLRQHFREVVAATLKALFGLVFIDR